MKSSTDQTQLSHPDWIAGIFLALRSGAYKDLGGSHTRYFLYCEDIDICARAFAACVWRPLEKCQ